MNTEDHIPEQNAGGQTDTIASVTLNNEAEAIRLFDIACARLRNVNDWEKICESNATKFDLIAANGEPAQRDALPGDYFRINIPGPGNSAGEGFDWVRVEDINLEEDEHDSIFSIRVKPASPPDKDLDETAHFFNAEASSTFMVSRHGSKVTAGVHGRNEQPNIKADHLSDKIRNAVVGTASLLGFSLPQWKMLVKGIVKQ